MRLRELPLLRRLEDVGPSDPVFDLLVLLGPVVLAVVAIMGRSIITELLVVIYLLSFPVYVALKAELHRPTNHTRE